MGSEAAIIVAAFLANLVTGWVKPPKWSLYKQEDLDARKTLVRVVNLILASFGLWVTAGIMGEPLEVGSFSESIKSLLEIGITFMFSQGSYLMKKN